MNYLLLLAGQALNNLIPLAIAPLIIYVLSLADWGVFSLFLIAGTFFTAGYTGKNQSIHSDLVKLMAKRHNQDRVLMLHAGIVFTMIKGKTPLVLIVITIAYLLHKTADLEYISIIIIGFVNGYLQSANSLARLKHLITSEYKSYFKLAAVFFIGKVLTVYLLLLTKIDVYNLIIAYTICNLLEVCARSRLLRNPQRVKHITLLQRRSNRLSFPLFLFVGSVLIDRFIIEYLFTKEHFGIYNLLMMFVSAIVFVMSPLNQFLLNSNNLKMTQQRYIGWCFVLFSIIALIGLPLTHNIPLLADNYFGTISRDHIFFVLLFTAFFQVLTGLTMIKHQRNQNISFYRFLGIITAMLNFLLIPSLAHIYQLGGALIGACIVSFLILVLAQSYRST